MSLGRIIENKYHPAAGAEGFYLFWPYICLFNAKLRQLLALKESSWTGK